MGKRTVFVVATVVTALLMLALMWQVTPQKMGIDLSLHAVAVDDQGAAQEKGVLTLRGQKVAYRSGPAKLVAWEIGAMDQSVNPKTADFVFHISPDAGFEFMTGLYTNETTGEITLVKIALAVDKSWCVMAFDGPKSGLYVASNDKEFDHNAILARCKNIFDRA